MVIPSRFSRTLPMLLLAAGLFCALGGCRSLPNSGFDPNGERLFSNSPFANRPFFNGNNNGNNSSPAIVQTTPPVNTVPASSSGASIYSPPPSVLPGDFGAAKTNPAVPLYGNTATPLPPNAHAVTTALIPNPDAGPTPVFNDTGGYALPTVPVTGPIIIMTPREQIAPIGSEVVLIASYLGEKDRLITNEKIEWSLEGTGTIEKFDPGFYRDILVFDYVKAKKPTDRYAVTKTSRLYQTIDRGTPDTADDIHLLRGQTWISVNSMKEGTTHVTAFAPNVADWSKRTDAGIIHWVDAQWVLPRLSMAPIGESRVLTTTVLRASNGQPRKGWIVRYEILNGPSAGLGSTGAQIEEIETDISGQATVFLTPQDQKPGTNTIGISIIRPAGMDGSDRRVTVGSETVRQTWTGTPNILVNIKGPSEAKLGQDLPYEITLTNRSSSFVNGVLSLPIPPLAAYISSNPAGQILEQTVSWNVNVQPNDVQRINVVLRQGTAGALWLKPEFRHQGSQPRAAMPSAPPVNTRPATPPAATYTPTDAGASRFPGTNPPAAPPAATFPGIVPNVPPSVPPNLTLRIEPDSQYKVEAGKPLYFYVYAENAGAAEVQNVELRVNLPPELVQLPADVRSQRILSSSEPKTQADWDYLRENFGTQPPPGVKLAAASGVDEVNNVAVLRVTSLVPGEKARWYLMYSPLPPQGYNITAEILHNGQRITQKTQRIAP